MAARDKTAAHSNIQLIQKLKYSKNAFIAQLAEHRSFKPRVAGSNLAGGTTLFLWTVCAMLREPFFLCKTVLKYPFCKVLRKRKIFFTTLR
jgi:hypothetical protein